MRYIIKRTSPDALETFKKQFLRTQRRLPTYRDLSHKPYLAMKHVVKESLLTEQYGLCCYCLKRIGPHNSHIEHLKPQSRFPEEDLAYTNLLASCNGIQNRNENCGHRKDDWYDEETISPLEPDCEKAFSFIPNGSILPKNDRAAATIQHLELNSFLLQRARQSAISASGLFDADFDEEKRCKLIAFYSTPHNGRLQAFCSAIIDCLEK